MREGPGRENVGAPLTPALVPPRFLLHHPTVFNYEPERSSVLSPTEPRSIQLHLISNNMVYPRYE